MLDYPDWFNRIINILIRVKGRQENQGQREKDLKIFAAGFKDGGRGQELKNAGGLQKEGSWEWPSADSRGNEVLGPTTTRN